MPNVSDVDRALAAPERRMFLTKTALCAGGLLCLGCGRAAAAQQRPPANTPAQPDTFAADSKMTFKEVYTFSYANGYIPLLRSLGRDIGREKFLPMLQAAASRAAVEEVKRTAPPSPKNTLAAFLPDDTNYFWAHVLSTKWIEKADKAAEIRVTACLWAATFRAAEAADIGYATICHPDFAATTAFNPKLRLLRTKTLMQGDECCNHRWVLDA